MIGVTTLATSVMPFSLTVSEDVALIDVDECRYAEMFAPAVRIAAETASGLVMPASPGIHQYVVTLRSMVRAMSVLLLARGGLRGCGHGRGLRGGCGGRRDLDGLPPLVDVGGDLDRPEALGLRRLRCCHERPPSVRADPTPDGAG